MIPLHAAMPLAAVVETLERATRRDCIFVPIGSDVSAAQLSAGVGSVVFYSASMTPVVRPIPWPLMETM